MAEDLLQEINYDIAVIEGVRDVAPAEIEREYRGIVKNTCIFSSRVGLEVLRHYGVRCRAIPVEVAVWNAAALTRMAREGRPPKDEGEMKRWSREDGSWSVGVRGGGRPTTANDWVGHLVLLVRAEDDEVAGVLIDLAAAQFSRPLKGIEVTALTQTVYPGFLSGEPCVFRVNECLARYNYAPHLPPWTHAPDWLDRDRRRFVVERTVKRIDRRLEERGLAGG